MWRLCDLHVHTIPDDGTSSLDLDSVVAACVADGLDVIAITDHDRIDAVESFTAAAADGGLTVVPGIEITTERGHILALTPGVGGRTVLEDFVRRVGVQPGKETAFENVVDVVRNEDRPSGERFSSSVVLVGAHVDQPGSLLGSGQTFSLAGQVEAATKLDALEVAQDSVFTEWRGGGVKQSDKQFALIRGSDWHSIGSRPERATWLFLPAIDAISFRHAFATREASIGFESRPDSPTVLIDELRIEGGPYDGHVFEFSERMNAIIGPPQSGKTLVIDALRFAFGKRCELKEIDALSEARMKRCLPDGSVVRVKGRHHGTPFTLERIRGATGKPVPPFQPIVFSQNELIRRAMEERPSMTLLDLHCPEAVELKERLTQLSGEVEEEMVDLVREAAEVGELAVIVFNPQDGLDAVKRQVEGLAGTEVAAQRANDVSRVEAWRTSVRETVTAWVNDLPAPARPRIKGLPTLQTDAADPSVYLPKDQIDELLQRFPDAVKQAAVNIQQSIFELLAGSEKPLLGLASAVSEVLAESGFEEGGPVLNKLKSLRKSLIELEELQRDLLTREGDIDQRIDVVCEKIRAIADVRLDLRKARNRACTKINKSMRNFFVKLLADQFNRNLDDLLEDAKVGTGKWSTTIGEMRQRLDRERMVHAIVRCAQGAVDRLPKNDDAQSQDDIVIAAMERKKLTQLVQLATHWPGDGVDLFAKGQPPQPFDELTEGMRALGIKEISFADSDLPVISDQPEDAVPTRAVFQSLVPTLREQRIERQFIVASHDGNIVVAGDVERIWVIRPGAEPLVGSLFDNEIRQAAMEHLEGGEEAFEQRRLRYRAGAK